MSRPGVTVERYESPTGWFELASRDPGPALRPHVRAYWGREGRSVQPVARLEPPYPDVIVSVGFGPVERVGGAAHRSFVAGLHETAARVEHDGDVRGVQLALTPLAAGALFGTPMDALASRAVELEDVLSEAAGLADRLEAIPSWAGRFDALDDFLTARLAEAPQPPPELAWAWRRLVRTGGRYPIGLLTAELGWSRKRLAGRFREHVGLPPKTFARLLRFRRAIALVTGEDDRRAGAIALDCGYYDQAHFNRDFREFAGVTPGELRRRLSRDDPGIPA